MFQDPNSPMFKYSYPTHTYMGSFGRSAFFPVEKNDFSTFIQAAEASLQKREYDDALAYAGKAAFHYGVAGLLHYIRIYSKIMSEDAQKGETVEEQVIQLLALLEFSKQMLGIQQDKAIKSMQEFAKEEFERAATPEFWTQLQSPLTELIDYSRFQADIASRAELLINDCARLPKCSH